jgi:hypothetical protein
MATVAQDSEEAYVIDQSRGVDQRVDYRSLTKFGPWDDRNYALTAEDLEFLSPDEADLHDPIPAFFRVELRKEMPNLRRSGPAQYPRSAVPLFQLRYGGLKRDAEAEDEPDAQKSKPCGDDEQTRR